MPKILWKALSESSNVGIPSFPLRALPSACVASSGERSCSVRYAAWTCLNRIVAASVLPWFLSGCHLSAARRYALRISSCEA